MQDDTQGRVDGLKQDIKAYSALKNVNKSEELDAFMELLINTVAQKMLWAFTTDSIKTWDDFLKLKGELVSYLYPIQEVRGADVMVKRLTDELNTLYKNPYNN